MTYRLCLVGYGKIARDQHHRVIVGHPAFELTCVVSRSGAVVDVPVFKTLDEALSEGPEVDAVVLCTPPGPRVALAEQAIAAGKAVFLEKPPTLTVCAAEALGALAFEAGVTVFASWHSRFAPFVEAARDWAEDKRIGSVEINWREDVLKWHPGQDWLWQPGGMGVFDPGINALSILTDILPVSVGVTEAVLHIPENKAMPIAAEMALSGPNIAGRAQFDFRETGDEVWNIRLTDAAGKALTLSKGGAALQIGDGPVHEAPEQEYRGLYDRFSALLYDGVSEMDLRPLQLVADAFLIAERRPAAPFHDPASRPR
ncbi:MAG: Gfo/Idh/MocA family oxidoreductase [Pseudomonadota bacterium]